MNGKVSEKFVNYKTHIYFITIIVQVFVKISRYMHIYVSKKLKFYIKIIYEKIVSKQK